MIKLSKAKQNILWAFEKGYKILDGIPFDPNGKMLKGTPDKDGYLRIGKRKMMIHKMVAYEKFGDKWLYSSLEVRHLDGNNQNNKYSNIDIGTKSQNMMDIPLDIRREYTKKALQKARSRINIKNVITAAREAHRSCSDEEVINIRMDRKQDLKLKIIAEKYNKSLSVIKKITNNNTYKHLI